MDAAAMEFVRGLRESCQKGIATLLALLALAPYPAIAQSTEAPATISGIVRDAETEEPLAGVLVSLIELERGAATDTAGRYVLRSVPPGPHHITFRVAGYKRHSLHALVPRTGELEINASLRVDPVQIAGVDVHAPIPVRGLERGDSTAFPDREASITAVRNHPLLAEPEIFQALGGGEVTLSLETPSGVHIEGSATDQTAYLLDGVPVFNPYHAAGVSSAWNPDALALVQLRSDEIAITAPHTLAGVVEGFTIAPSERLRVQAAVSSTQARLTLDGPLGSAGAAFLFALRAGLHDLIAPQGDASYLSGGTRDVLASVRTPILGGRMRLLGYANANEIGALAEPETSGVADRHAFEWENFSFGAEWRRDFASTAVRALGWGAVADETATWEAPNAPVDLSATRRDAGFLASVERRTRRATTTASVRFDLCRTSGVVNSRTTATPVWDLDADTPIGTAAAQQSRSLGGGRDVDMGLSLAATGGDLYLGARAQLSWKVVAPLTLSARYAHTNQFVQSLRNAESVVGTLFPVDVFVGAGAPGVPVAGGDHFKLAAEYRPAPGVRLGVIAYARAAEGVVLVAPREGGPFSTGAFIVGSSTARGLALDFAMSSRRYGILASYGLQRVRYEFGDSSYVPEHGAMHVLEGGVIAYPSATTSARFGVAAAFGRRATVARGGLEWESCNLLDRGCEFVGSPVYDGETLGGEELPAYVRLDMGLRKHWHVRTGGRDTEIALFGTFTNVLGRKNLLTYSRDPVSGSLLPIEMRPSAPLVVGMDVRF
jgi:hypothetical protein